ncbi:MAG: cytochrome b N-terminal domain-containing protein [Nitrospinota bacterium]|nr:cytochrome b N-terminal domain-containing protein [Nitrospinota bacterium]
MKQFKATRKRLIPALLRPGYSLIIFLQEILNKLFTPILNPMYLLGATNFLLFWILLATGGYLFLFYDMSPERTYESVQYLTIDQKYYGGIIRSFHRYASDLMLVTLTFHVFHVLFMDRFRKTRMLAWFTGVAIIPTFWVTGLSGYFLVWDQKAQLIATYAAEALDMLPISAEPISRNLLSNSSVNSMIFFVMTFMHIAVPIGILILAWVHCMRVSKPLLGPPQGLAIPIFAFFLALSLLKPAVSLEHADLSVLITKMEIDWFYMFPIAIPELFDISFGKVLSIIIASLALLFVLPLFIKDPPKDEEEMEDEDVKKKPASI